MVGRRHRVEPAAGRECRLRARERIGGAADRARAERTRCDRRPGRALGVAQHRVAARGERAKRRSGHVCLGPAHGRGATAERRRRRRTGTERADVAASIASRRRARRPVRERPSDADTCGDHHQPDQQGATVPVATWVRLGSRRDVVARDGQHRFGKPPRRRVLALTTPVLPARDRGADNCDDETDDDRAAPHPFPVAA